MSELGSVPRSTPTARSGRRARPRRMPCAGPVPPGGSGGTTTTREGLPQLLAPAQRWRRRRDRVMPRTERRAIERPVRRHPQHTEIAAGQRPSAQPRDRQRRRGVERGSSGARRARGYSESAPLRTVARRPRPSSIVERRTAKEEALRRRTDTRARDGEIVQRPDRVTLRTGRRERVVRQQSHLIGDPLRVRPVTSESWS